MTSRSAGLVAAHRRTTDAGAAFARSTMSAMGFRRATLERAGEATAAGAGSRRQARAIGVVMAPAQRALWPSVRLTSV
jgi:hypothetical protein